MLILSRKPGESIVIDGRITVRIMRVEGDVVKLGVEAPIEIPVHRQEVYDEIRKSNKEALSDDRARAPQLSKDKPTPPKPERGERRRNPNRPGPPE